MTVEKIVPDLLGEFQAAKTTMRYMQRIKFWLPEPCKAIEVTNYINCNFPDYEAHAKENVLRNEKNFPAISIGKKNKFAYPGNEGQTLGELSEILVIEYKKAKILPHFWSVQLLLPEDINAESIANFITNNYACTAYEKRLCTIVIS